MFFWCLFNLACGNRLIYRVLRGFDVFDIGCRHAHFCAIPNLATPTDALKIDEARTSSAAPWIVVQWDSNLLFE